MAHGMSGFLDSPVKSIQDWDKYCYYAAGVVGIGLSKMWVASGLESNKFLSEDFKLKSKEMGLLLQKTNIIRDCREDILQNRAFLPQEIWGKYLNNYSELFQLKHKEAALHSLNEYVTDALKHTPSCLDYLREITSPSIFRFCAIPQVMAIATLALCYNNYSVFLESVKIPRFESIQIMTGSSNYPNVLKYFSHYAERVTAKIPTADPISVTIAQRLEEIIKRNEKVQYSQH
jgi:farnesyl-diphosphate farnesyltransferase